MDIIDSLNYALLALILVAAGIKIVSLCISAQIDEDGNQKKKIKYVIIFTIVAEVIFSLPLVITHYYHF